jgi:hypothetical protein
MAVMIAGCLLLSCAEFGIFRTAPDRSKWRSHTILLSEWKLTFDTPVGSENEPWDHLWVKPINLEYDSHLLIGEPAQIFNASWTYRGTFLEGLLGRLRVAMFVIPRAKGYETNMRQREELESYIRQHESQLWSPHNERYLKTNLERFLIILPQVYDRIMLGNGQWLRYKFNGQFDYYGYAIGLRETQYLEIQFDFIDNTDGRKRGDWRPDAERLREEIAATLRLEKA